MSGEIVGKACADIIQALRRYRSITMLGWRYFASIHAEKKI